VDALRDPRAFPSIGQARIVTEIAMEPQAFEEFLAASDQVRGALQRAAQAVPAMGHSAIVDMAALVLLLPLVRLVLMDIGLPWLATLRKYSDVQRCRVEDGIDAHAESHGLDPDAVEAESRQLLKELEQTTGADARGQWDRLTELLKQ
jgi:hypothetical protein